MSKTIEINLEKYPKIGTEVKSCFGKPELEKDVALGVLKTIKGKSDLKTVFNFGGFFAKPVVSIPSGAFLIFASMSIINSIIVSTPATFPIFLASAIIVTLFAGLCLIAFGIAHCIFGKFPNLSKERNEAKILMNYIEKNVGENDKVKFIFGNK